MADSRDPKLDLKDLDIKLPDFTTLSGSWQDDYTYTIDLENSNTFDLYRSNLEKNVPTLEVVDAEGSGSIASVCYYLESKDIYFTVAADFDKDIYTLTISAEEVDA